jgi:PleD family two-component response regulator
MTQKILLVEDSRYQRMASKRVLAEAGVDVVEASDGEQALHQVQESPPDLIILDILLPRLGGEQVLFAKTRQQPAFR